MKMKIDDEYKKGFETACNKAVPFLVEQIIGIYFEGIDRSKVTVDRIADDLAEFAKDVTPLLMDLLKDVLCKQLVFKK